ncbi:MAG: hypothetical protein Fur0018_12710 [Anaerolineales bacterium]
MDLLAENAWQPWLAGALTHGRMRRKRLGAAAEVLGCRQVFLFPAANAMAALLVGADDLPAAGRNFWQTLAMRPPAPSQPPQQSQPFPFGVSEVIPYDLNATLEQVLAAFVGQVPCRAAFIALRVAHYLELRAVWQFPAACIGQVLSLQSSSVWRRLASRPAPLRWHGWPSPEAPLPAGDPDILEDENRVWLGIPIAINQRVIGVVVGVAAPQASFDDETIRRAAETGAQFAYLVENAIMLDEAGRQLQQLALVNELSSTTVGETHLEKAIRRVLQRLERTLTHTSAGLLWKLSGEWQAIGSGDLLWHAVDSLPQIENLDSLETYRQPWQVKRAPHEAALPWLHPAVQVYLFVPLIYRAHFVGLLQLGRVGAQAFSRQEEKNMFLLAGHLAGLLENVRLNADARQRAENLALIHAVVQRVIGLTSVDDIAQRTAMLMTERFAFDRVLVVNTSAAGDSFTILGVAGLDTHTGLRGARHPADFGLFRMALQDGRSVRIASLVADEGLPLPPLPQAAAMIVPLSDAERILGAVYVERVAQPFSSNDLIALQALAGVLSSVMVNAQRYQQLQTSVRQLQAVRETALDMAGEMDLEVLLRRVVHRVRLLVEARGAELALLEPQDDKVRVVVSENPWRDYTGRVVPLMAGIIGRVAALGTPMSISDYNAWDGREEIAVPEPFCAVAAVPLKIKGQVIGVLTVNDDKVGRVFRSDDVRLLELLAPQVAVFIRNARLYHELQERMVAQKNTEQQLVRSARLAAVGEMAAGVAHELNNPLTTVSGFVELVLDELPPDAPQRADLELVLREAYRARSVVRNLLDFSRPSEDIRLNTDINELIGDVFTLVQHLVRTTGVELRIQFWDDLPRVKIDPNQIKQVLLNLIHNALQAMPNGGVLVVQTAPKRRRRKRWLSIRVEDSGVGIPQENLARIFEPFFTTRPVGSGTGLGLSVSYGIIKEHGGFIEVESTPGSGSCFTVWLPVDTDA